MTARSDAAEDDGQWMTYAEIASRFGKSHPAAEQMARRKKWKRQQKNHPHDLARYWVPIKELLDSVEAAVGTGEEAVDTRAWKALLSQVDRERTHADRAEQRLAKAEAKITELENELANVRSRDAWGLPRRLRWAIWGI